MNKWVVEVYRKDARCKAGEKLQEKFEYQGVTEAGMQTLIENMQTSAFPTAKYRVVFHPATKIVKNLMTGNDVEIAYDTPRYCDPSSEAYWSM